MTTACFNAYVETFKSPQGAVMVIGAWVDADTTAFRARLMHTSPADGNDEHVAYAASPDDVTDLVAQWLNEIVS